MATSVWKGHLTFGLVSIPVKLYRAARAEKVGFRQVHQATGTRVRQALYREPQELCADNAVDRDDELPSSATVETRSADGTIPFPVPARPVEVSREELAKGYEYEPGRYLVLSRDEMESITPRTAHEMQILEFVRLAEVDPIYFETFYYVAPDRAGEHAYALLLEALRSSAFVAIAQVAMHRREHVVVIRPGRSGIVLHTMFYESEIRRADEHRADGSNVSQKELDLALLLVNSLVAAFDASKYRDTYREKLDALIAAKLDGLPAAEVERRRHAPVVNILEALQRSLQSVERKPPAAAAAVEEKARKTTGRRKRTVEVASETTAS